MSTFSFTRNNTTNKINTKRLSLTNNPKINNNQTTLSNNNGYLDLSVLSLNGISVTSSGNQLNYINSITNGIGSLNKALITDNSNSISNINSIGCNTLIVNGNTITLSANNNTNSGSSDSNSPYLQKIKIGKVQNSKALVLDTSKNIETINKLSINELELSNNNKIINNSSEYINKKKIHPITLTDINSSIQNNLIKICWSSELSLAVAISNSGTNRIFTSSDGINWIQRNTPVNNNWTDIIWSVELGLFTIIANSGTDRVLTSNNGIDWISRNTNIYPTLFALGDNNTAILTNNDSVYISGSNSYGQIGNGNTTSQGTPILVSSINNISKIEYGPNSGFFLLNDGTIKSIGYNINGELGIGNNTNQTTFQLISNLNDVIDISIATTGFHVLALLSDNTVKSWGLNTNGQLGNNSTISSNIPVTVSELSNVIAISASENHSLALLNNGTIKSWGSNTYGQLGDNSTTQRLIPVSVVNITNAIAIATGSNCSFALLNDGTIKSWGHNTVGQLGDTTLIQRQIPVTVSGINNATSVSVSSSFGIALLSDKTIKVWGHNHQYQLGDGTTNNKSTPFTMSGITNVKYIKTGYSRSMILLEDNTILRWGYGISATPIGNFDYWTVNNNWSSVTWSPQLSLLIAVSNTNTSLNIMSSSNGIKWFPRIGSNTNNWTSICWSPELNLFAAVANSGTTNRIMTSSDGITWSNQNNSYLHNWTSICWVPRVKLFMAVSNTGIYYRVMTSSDGTTWTMRYSPFYGNWNTIYDVPELNLTIAISDLGPEKIMYTYNGTEWFLGTININFPLNSIVWADKLNKFLVTSSNTYNYSNISYTNTNLMTTSNWYSLFNFTKISLNSSYTMVQSGSNPDVQLQINATTATSSMNSLWYNQRIQDGTSFTINFEIRLLGTADASSFNIGHTNTSFFGDGPNKPAFSLVFHMISTLRPVGIYLFDDNGVLLNYYAYTLSENIWRTVQIIYTNSTTNTWQFYFNNVNIFNYSNVNHNNWLATSGSYFGFGTRNGGSAHDITIRRFTLSGNLINSQTSTIINSKIYNSNVITNSLELKNYGRILNMINHGEEFYMHKLIGNINTISNQFSFSPSKLIWISELNIYIMGNTTNNSIAYSSDGVNWFTTLTITGFTIKSLCWSPELQLIVAVSNAGINNNVITSPDGINWTLRTNVPNTIIPWYGICWSSALTLFVAVGYGPNSTINRVMTSPDGINWTLRKAGAYNGSWADVCWSPELNIFVAISNNGGSNNYVTMYSYNGIDWMAGNINIIGSSGNYTFKSICWSPILNLFAAVSNDRVIISSDGINWAFRIINNYTWSSICWASGLNAFIIVADSATNNFAYSIDGLTWNYKNLVLSDPNLNAVCWSNDLNQLTAVGYAKVLNLPNLKYSFNSLNNNNNLTYFNNYDKLNNISLYDNWNYINNGVNNQWTSICYSSDLNLLVAISNSGTNNRIITSSDGGYTWISQTNPIDNNWTSICYSSNLNLFVAVANSGTNDRVMTSSDGINWTSRTSATDNDWASICYSSDLNLFVVVSTSGTNNRVMISADGINWTSRTSAVDNDWTSICYSSDLNLFVAVSKSGTNNRVMTSPNGINWTSRISAENNNWTSVCWAYKLNLFVAIANSGTNNRVMVSSDGINWTTNNIIYKNISIPKTLSMNSIFAGGNYSFAIHGDSHMVKGWGWDSSNYSTGGSLGNYPVIQSNPINIKKMVGSGSVVKFLLNDGTIRTRGNNNNSEIGHISNSMFYYPYSYLIPNINNAIDIATGSNYTIILLNDGTVKGWGQNGSGQLGTGNTTIQYQPILALNITNAISISAHTDGSHTLVLLNDGTIKSFGLNNYGQLGNGNDITQNTAVSVSNINNAIVVAVGGNHSLALLNDGTIKSWGLNTSGQLGNNSTTNSNIPVTVSGISNAIAIAAGSEFSLAILSDGTVKSWGKNNYGQLGNGNTGTNQLVPVSVSNLTNIIGISAGSNHSIALLSNGQLKTWGYNNRGQLGDGTTTDRNIPVTVVNSATSGDIFTNIRIDKTLNNDYANNNWTSICWSDEMRIFIAIANSGTNNRIMVSNDGYTWYSKNTNENNNFTSICWADLLSKFFIISSDGTNNILYSNLGIPNLLSTATLLGTNQLLSNNNNYLLINGSNTGDYLNITEDSNNKLLRLSYNNSNTNSVDFISSLSPNYQLNIINNSNNKITNIVNHNGSTYGLSFNNVVMPVNVNDLNKLKVSTFGQAEASKPLILNSSLNIANINNISLNKLIVNNKIIYNSTDNSSNYLSNITPGIADNSKALVVDSNKNIEYLNNISSSNIYLNNFNNVTSTFNINSYNKKVNYFNDLGATRLKYPSNITPKTIIWVNDFNLFIATGTVITSNNSTGYTINISSDGINWKAINSIYYDINSYNLSLAYSPSLKMVVGYTNNRIYYTYNGSIWYNKYSSSPTTFTSICWADTLNLFVAVSGNTNQVHTSPDGINWTTRTPASNNNWTSITWANSLGLLVAVSSTGTSNRVMTSSDGITWTSRTSASNNNWTSICWSPNLSLFVAVSNSGTGNRIMTSSDGINWTSRTSAADNNWQSICWASTLSLFIVVGNGTNTCLMKSSNGTSWSTINTTNFNGFYYSICYSPELNLLVAGSDGSTYAYNKIITSNDGNNWTLNNTSNDVNWSDMIYISELSLFVTIANTSAINSYQFATSTDGVDWTFGKINSSASQFRNLAWASSLSLLITCGSSLSTTFYRTSDCITWTATTVPSGTWSFVKWISQLNLFIAVASSGTNRAIKSSDGINWSVITLPSTQSLYSIDYSTLLNMIIISSIGNPSIYFTSTDGGNNWTQRTLVVNGTNISFSTSSICYLSEIDKFILYDYSQSYTYYMSSNGINWTKYTISTSIYPTGSFYGLPDTIAGRPVWISKFNKYYVISTITGGTLLLESSDAINWTIIHKLGGITNYKNLCWANSIETLIGYGQGTTSFPSVPFVYLNQYLLPEKNYNLNSINKLNKLSSTQINNSINTWISRTSAIDNDWTSICYSPELNLFVAVSNTGTNNRVMTSPDSITWTSRTSAANNNWSSVCWSSELNLFAAVSTSGTGNRIMTSPDGITWTSRTNPVDNNWTSICWANDLKLFVALSNTGTNNRIMISSNGLDWQTIIPANNNNWTSICWSPELTLLVAVANTGTGDRIMTSSDGINWTSRTNPVDNNWTSVCWSPELTLFVAVSNTGIGDRIMISSDGITWISRTNPVDNDWISICWASNLEIFIAISNTGTNDRIMISIDGINWIIKNNSIDNNWTSICWSNMYNMAVAVSNSGSGNRILTSSISVPYLQYKYPCSQNTLYINQTNGNVGLGTYNPNYQLELSTDSAGKPSSAYWTVSSDARLKENIEDADLDLCYNNVKNLRLVQYTWKDEIYQDNKTSVNIVNNQPDYPVINSVDNPVDNLVNNVVDNVVDNSIDNSVNNSIDIISNRTQLGWIADEVENILPKSIRTVNAYNLDNCKTLDSDQIIASMYGTAKKLLNEYENQNNKIILLKDKINELEKFINELNIIIE